MSRRVSWYAARNLQSLMFRTFERIINPTAEPSRGPPPAGFVAFYWHFIGQARGLFVALLVVGLALAFVDAAIPAFIGHLVKLVATVPREQLFESAAPALILMGATIVLVRPILVLLQALVQNQAIMPGMTNMIRWQSHWHVVRQSLGYFQGDFAGRIASRVMETGFALRQSAVSIISTVWYLAAFAVTALILMVQASGWLGLPMLLWIVGYVALLVYIVPRVRRASREISYARSAVTGRIVDSYTNILTVKLFARGELEDDHVRSSIDWHNSRMWNQLRFFTGLGVGLALLGGFLIVSTGTIAMLLWRAGTIDVQAIAMVLPLTLTVSTTAARVANEITNIFEQFGTVHEGMDTIARPLQLTDREGAKTLQVPQGAVRFDAIRFHYGRDSGVIDNLTLNIGAGEKVGLVGRSGAGKSTLVNLLLRFYDLEGGRILIDGQDIADVTQQSLREQIAVVTQDTSLLHRSIRENILYGRPEAGEDEMLAAARKAHAHDFILDLEDGGGRYGYDAHVGERGVKLSGGQRQRVAIARVILKDSPILILDAATSALDSEVEAEIQGQLDQLMAGKTVIAIAHRLSTIARMDRLVVLDRGQIIEQGSHAELLAKNGIYAGLWRRQSGGFLGDDDTEPKAAE